MMMKYLCDPHVIPTNTCPPDLVELERRSRAFASFAQDVQLDVADGSFAPVVSWPYGPGQFEDARRLAGEGGKLPCADTLRYEAHLMVADPKSVGSVLAQLGVMRLVPHIEAFADAEEASSAFEEWKAAGVSEVGLALLIDTPLERLDGFIEKCDVVQLMSIAKIGAQGQPFDDRTFQRVEELHAKYPDMMVAVDGGVSEANVESLARAGANRLCVGSAISSSEDPARTFASIHERAMKGCAPLQTEFAI